MKIRQLTARDGANYRDLRLTALKTDPSSYLSSYKIESERHVNNFSTELEHAQYPPVYAYYGAFLPKKPNNLQQDMQLVGYVQISHSYFPKQKHLAFLYNLYTDPNHRKQGIASTLLQHVVKKLKEKTPVERIFLTCNAKNKKAYRFYKKFGFRRCGIKPRSIKWDGEYDDEVEMVLIL